MTGLPPLTDPLLDTLLAGIVRRAEEALDGFVASAVVPRAEALAAWADGLLGVSDPHALVRRIRHALEQEDRDRTGLEADADAAFARVAEALAALPWEIEVPLDPALLAPTTSEPLATRLRRVRTLAGVRFARLRGGVVRRRVPVRAVIRMALEARVAEALATAAASFRRTEAEVLAILRGSVQHTRPAEARAARDAVDRFLELTRDDLRSAVRVGATEAATRLAVAGGPSLPATELRLADAEARVEAAVQRLRGDAEPWAERVRAAEDTVRVALLVETFAESIGATLRRRAKKPLAMARDALLSELTEVASRLEATAAPLGDAPAEQGLGEAVRGCEALLSSRQVEALRRASERFRRATQPGQLVAELAELQRHLPDRLSVVDRATPVERATRPDAVLLSELPLARKIGAIVENELLPSIGAAIASATELVASNEARVREAISVARYAADLASRGGFETPEERREVVVDGFARGVRRIREVEEQLAAAFEHAALALDAAERDATAKLRALLARKGDPTAQVAHTLRSSLRTGADVARKGWQLVVARTRDVEAAARRVSRQRALRDLKIRSGHERLDAHGIREYLDAFLPPAEARGIPTVYVRLMSPAPVTEPRLFVGRGPLARRLVDELSGESVVRVPSTLVVGPGGAGKSSLLNLVTLQLVGPRVLWLDPAFASRDDGPLVALATELGAASAIDTVLDALTRTPTVVLIDDLQCWLAPGPRGLDQLEDLLRLMARAASTRWLVSIDDAALSLLEEGVALRPAFRRVLPLEPLDWRELQELFEVRERLGGFDTIYRAGSLLGRAVDRLRPGHEQENYFRALASAADGNPGTALAAHLDAVQVEGESALRVGTPARPALPFLEQLGEDALALLAGLVRYGPMPSGGLADLLGDSEEELAAGLGFLLHAGLVAPARGGRQVGLSPRVAAAVRHELTELAVLPGRSA